MDRIRIIMLCILVAMFVLAGLFLFGHLGPSINAILKLAFGLLGLSMVILSIIRTNRAKKKNEAQQDNQE